MGAGEFTTYPVSGIATAAIVANRFVKQGTTAAETYKFTAAAAGEYPFGVSVDDADAAADPVAIEGAGKIGMLEVNGADSNIAAGDYLKPTTAGVGIKAASGDVAGAIAMEPATADGDIIRVAITGPWVVGTPAAGEIKMLYVDADGTAAITASHLTASVVPVELSFAGVVAVSIPAVTEATNGTIVRIHRTGAGVVTITPASGTIGGSATHAQLDTSGQVLELWGDYANTDWKVISLSPIYRDLAVHTIPLTDLRTWDAMGALLPTTAGTDDLALIVGTPGTDAPTVQGADAGGTTATNKAGFVLVLPPNYRDGETITLQTIAGVLAVADTSATIDCNAYPDDEDGTVSADICSTAAQSINSTTLAAKSFTLTPTGLVPGGTIHVVITTAVTDAGNLAPNITAVIAKIAALIDTEG